uniref:Uncharacterized protein n=1 Tax=Arundo donax TaxID=35708 RepID=A0A0A9H7Q0_ARUDO
MIYCLCHFGKHKSLFLFMTFLTPDFCTFGDASNLKF